MSQGRVDLFFINIAEILTCESRNSNLTGGITAGALAVQGEKIIAVGEEHELAGQFDLSRAEVVNLQGKILAPGFVDCHTHAVFGGSRVQEYALRMTRTTEEIHRLGIPTGIPATVETTRRASEEELLLSAASRLKNMLQAGTTTVEIKSGYGLDSETELKMLRVNRLLAEFPGPQVISTLLGAHAFPADRPPERYLEEVITEMIPRAAAAGLADFCDVYVDAGYFNVAQARQVLLTARAAGLKLKIHADQYSAQGGSELAAELSAVSADHLNYTSPETLARLADAGVVAVLMPLIDFAVRHPKPIDGRKVLSSGVPVALATDLCPGGWTESMQLVMQFACRQHGFSPAEALLAATIGGARALALEDRGLLAPGYLADLQVWDTPIFEDVIYRLGSNLVDRVYQRGKLTYLRS